MPGLSIGGEAKVGVYGNHATQRTNIADALARRSLYWRRSPRTVPRFWAMPMSRCCGGSSQHWTFRTGYMFLWMDEVALATDNFNPDVPLRLRRAPRRPVINNSSDVFYHGFTAGFEYMW